MASLTADVMIVRTPSLDVLLIRRGGPPFKGLLALPGGFVEEDESFIEGARREAWEEVGLPRHTELVFSHVEDDPFRDPRGRVVSGVFIALVGEAWTPQAGDDAASYEWVPLKELLDQQHAMAFDHADVIARAARLPVVPT